MTTPMTPQPTPAQRHWMNLKFGMFLHFGLNTFYDLEWSDGTLDPAGFNPTEFDPAQWCSVAKNAGMKFIVMVTKHHDGFCNWRTQHTDYSVAASPFQRDVVGEVVEAARRHGLEVGLYYSLWDRNHPAHDSDDAAYTDYMKRQLSELLMNYGPIVELWFDGGWKKQANGWDGDAAAFQRAWRDEGAPRWGWDELYAHIKSLQPNCLVANNSTTAFPGVPLCPVDLRPGEKATEAGADQKIWNCGDGEIYLPLQIETTMSQSGPPGDFESGSWFWHDWDKTAATPQQIRDWLDVARQKDAVLLLNCGPMSNGKLRPEDVAALEGLG